MKRKLLSVSLILCLVFVILIGTAFASTYQKEATLHYRDIKITLNGEAITPTDASGNAVEPFIIDGTTYLPVRAIANAMGLDVQWDGETSTAVLSEPAAERSVYITRTGSKYHDSSTCNGGTYWAVPYNSAVGMGLTACEKCAGGSSDVTYSRLNPAPVGSTQTITIDNYSYNYTTTITVDEVLSGEEMNEVLGSVVANDTPDSDCEIVAVKVRLSLDDISADRSIHFSDMDFESYTSNNESLSSKYIYLKDGYTFDATLYKGGSMEGYITMQRKIGDTGAKIAFGLNYDGTGGIWFQIA